jgi:putative FmdB family regulatory protein
MVEFSVGRYTEGAFVPLYEYECAKCRHRFEKIEHVDASTTKKCPKCGARAARLPSAPAIQFKGSGWYVTDYAGKNSAAAASEEKSSEKSFEKSSDSAAEKASDKSEKKPAAKENSRKQQKKES